MLAPVSAARSFAVSASYATSPSMPRAMTGWEHRRRRAQHAGIRARGARHRDQHDLAHEQGGVQGGTDFGNHPGWENYSNFGSSATPCLGVACPNSVIVLEACSADIRDLSWRPPLPKTTVVLPAARKTSKNRGVLDGRIETLTLLGRGWQHVQNSWTRQ
jgi:hypothetical protein